jgi:hypothetical protein
MGYHGKSWETTPKPHFHAQKLASPSKDAAVFALTNGTEKELGAELVNGDA